jgi:hypothetical protein
MIHKIDCLFSNEMNSTLKEQQQAINNGTTTEPTFRNDRRTYV